VAVFGYTENSPVEPDNSMDDPQVELNRLALRPDESKRVPTYSPAAPRRWWEAFTKRAPRSSGDGDEAAIRNLQAQAYRQAAGLRHLHAWRRSQFVGLVASAQGWANPAGGLLDADARLRDVFAISFPASFAFGRDDSPPAVLYLAIRAARRAIAADPMDAQAHAALGEAYLRLIRDTRERAWAQPLSELIQLRRTQAVAALDQSVAINPDFASAHFQLGVVYQEMGFLDLSVEHIRAFLNIVRKPGRTGRMEGQSELIAAADRELEKLANMVFDRESQFNREAEGLRVYDRALLARELGLAGKARDILLDSDISAFGANGLALELELLVRTGRIREVRDWTSPEQQEALGPMYHWWRVQAFAAGGEYELAREECTRLAIEGSAGYDGSQRRVIATLAGEIILDGERTLRHVGQPAWDLFRQSSFRTRVSQLVSTIRRESDVIALRGLLALEAGDTAMAVADFRTALAAWVSPAAAADRSGIDFNARRMCQGALEWIESVPP
jgi:hypothetical protein